METSTGNENILGKYAGIRDTGLRNRDVRNIWGKITVKQVQGKQLLVQVIGCFEKSRVREIGVLLHFSLLRDLK